MICYFEGLTSQGIAACNLLPCLALARSTISSRIKTIGSVSVSIQCKTERSLHQSVSLHTCRKSGITARTGATAFRICAGPFVATVSTGVGTEYAAQR